MRMLPRPTLVADVPQGHGFESGGRKALYLGRLKALAACAMSGFKTRLHGGSKAFDLKTESSWMISRRHIDICENGTEKRRHKITAKVAPASIAEKEFKLSLSSTLLCSLDEIRTSVHVNKKCSILQWAGIVSLSSELLEVLGVLPSLPL